MVLKQIIKKGKKMPLEIIIITSLIFGGLGFIKGYRTYKKNEHV